MSFCTIFIIFVHYFGMISRQFGMKILFTFLTEKKQTVCLLNFHHQIIVISSQTYVRKYRTKVHEKVLCLKLPSTIIRHEYIYIYFIQLKIPNYILFYYFPGSYFSAQQRCVLVTLAWKAGNCSGNWYFVLLFLCQTNSHPRVGWTNSKFDQWMAANCTHRYWSLLHCYLIFQVIS